MDIEELKNKIQSFDLIYSTSTTNFSKLINKSHKIANGCGGVYSHVGIVIKGDIFPENTIFKSRIDGFADYIIDPTKLYIFESVLDTKNECPCINGCHIDGVQLREFDIVIDSYFNLKSNRSMTNIAWCKLNDSSREKINKLFNGHKNYCIDDNLYYINENKYKNEFSKFVCENMSIKYNFSMVDQLFIPFHSYLLIRLVKNVKDYFCGSSNELLCSELVGLTLIKLGLISADADIHKMMPENFLPKNENETYDNVKQIPVLYESPIEILNLRGVVELLLDDIITNAINNI
jgi:hypothetical protein